MASWPVPLGSVSCVLEPWSSAVVSAKPYRPRGAGLAVAGLTCRWEAAQGGRERAGVRQGQAAVGGGRGARYCGGAHGQQQGKPERFASLIAVI